MVKQPHQSSRVSQRNIIDCRPIVETGRIEVIKPRDREIVEEALRLWESEDNRDAWQAGEDPGAALAAICRDWILRRQEAALGLRGIPLLTLEDLSREVAL